MENKEREPRYYADIIAAMAERTIRRLWVLCIALALLLAATIGGFLWHLNQYDFESYTTEYAQDGSGINIIGESNGVGYGAAFASTEAR